MNASARGRRAAWPGGLALCLVCLVALGLAAGCSSTDQARIQTSAEDSGPPPPPPPADVAPRAEDVTLPPPPPVPALPLGLPDLPDHAPGPEDAARVALGRLLFFDPRLSADGSMSCASCHDPDSGWSDGRERALTAAGKPNLRHTPTLVNLVYAPAFFWDGRMTELEAMILAHWKGQMLAGASPASRIARLAVVAAYPAHFRRAFGRSSDPEDVAGALAAFVRTIFSGASPWDRYEAGDRAAVSEDAIAGFAIFTQKAQCALCHPPPLYTDGGYHAVGVGSVGPDQALIDPGRALVTGAVEDHGSFKTPTLRGVGRSAPYYHDGSAATLAETLEHGLRAATRHAAPDTVPARLTPDEVRKLLAFFAALTPESSPYARPRLPGIRDEQANARPEIQPGSKPESKPGAGPENEPALRPETRSE